MYVYTVNTCTSKRHSLIYDWVVNINQNYTLLYIDPSDLVSSSGSEATSAGGGGGGSRKRSKVSSGGKARKGSSSEGVAAGEMASSIGGRDSALFLFRALGKILYCKRSSLQHILKTD